MKTINNIANEAYFFCWSFSQDNTTSGVWNHVYYEIWDQVWEELMGKINQVKEELKP